MAQYALTTAPTLINTVGTLIDGLTRGTTITAVPRLMAKTGVPPNIWSTAILSGVAVSSGGWVVQGLGLAEGEWKVARPNILSGGLMDTLDMTSGAAIGLLYAAMTRSLPQLAWLSDLCTAGLPRDYVSTLAVGEGRGKDVVDSMTARAICVLALAAMLLARVVWKLVQADTARQIKRSTHVDIRETSSETAEVIKQPAQVQLRAPVGTPRKRNKA